MIRSRLLWFFLAQLSLALGALVLGILSTRHYIDYFGGVQAAQFALLGVWLGVGDRPLRQRVLLAGLGSLGLASLTMLQPHFNGWVLLLDGARLAGLGAVFLAIRTRGKLVLRLFGHGEEPQLLRLTLRQFLALTVAVAVFLGLERCPWLAIDVVLVVWVVLIGLAGALVSLVVAAAVLSKPNIAGRLIALGVSLLLIVALGGWCYTQSHSWRNALGWSATALLEALVMGASLAVLRRFGYRLTAA